MHVELVSSYQPTLLEGLWRAGVTHGSEGRIHLRSVNVTPIRNQRAGVSFGSRGRVETVEMTKSGDGGPLPRSVSLVGFKVKDREFGPYDLLNVQVIAKNGTLALKMDKEASAKKLP